MFYDSLHVTIMVPNTAEDALNEFENWYCAELELVKTIVVHVQKLLLNV